MMYTMEGTVKIINETQTWDSGFKKREIVITTDDQYPQDVKFEFIKDSVELLEDIKIGDETTISFNIRGNEYNDKYYVNLTGNAIKVNGKTKNVKVVIPDHSNDDDIPF